MQLLESLFRRNQPKPIQENVSSNQTDTDVTEEILTVTPVPRLIDKETHPLRFREGFERYADDWNKYAVSSRLSFQEKVLSGWISLCSLRFPEIEIAEAEIRSKSYIKPLQEQKLQLDLEDIPLKKKKGKIRELNKRMGTVKHGIHLAKRMIQIRVLKDSKIYSCAKSELIRADEEFATGLDVERLVFYCYCNSIADQDEVNRLAVMLGRKKNLGRDDLFDLNLRLPTPLSPTDDLEERFRKVKELTNRQMEMINSNQSIPIV